MRPSVDERLADVHPKMLRAESESLRNKLAVGRQVARALELAGLTKQDAAYQMGYRDQGVISRWCSGVERPLFDKLFTLAGFEDAYLLALAEKNPRVEVVTEIRMRRQSA